MPQQSFEREIEISDREASRYFEYLERLLGSDRINAKLASITKEMSQETGAYLHYWVAPKNAIWLGLQESREFINHKIPFAGNLSPNMELSLELAAKLMTLTDSMPERQLTELKNRILGSEDISPIFFEMNVASHFWQTGFEIEWITPSDKPGIKSAEFIARKSGYSIEIECKTKKPDAGRKIQRRGFYRLIDAISEKISGWGLSGQIHIVVPEQMPMDKGSHDEILNSIAAHRNDSVSEARLDNGMELSFDLTRKHVLLPAASVGAKIAAMRKPYSMVGVIYTQTNGGYIISPLIICVDSQLTDRFLDDVLDTLREANHQFSEKLPSLVCCYVPEIEDFSGMESGSAIARMTEHFFIKHSKSCVFAVSYVSDTQRDEFGIFVSKSMPSLTFMNPNYSEELGKVPSIYQG